MTAPKPKNRIVGLRQVRAGDLKPNPRNWRLHPPEQRHALETMLDRIGWVNAVIARKTDDGLELVDGHLRSEIDPDAKIPVLVVDLSEDEANQALATLDPLSAMAQADQDALLSLLQQTDVPPIDFGDLVVPEFEPTAEPDRRLDERASVNQRICPACGHVF